MQINNLALKVIEEYTDLSNVFIGTSRFTDDVWDLRIFYTKKTVADNRKILRFGYIHNEDMKLTVKQYAYYQLGKFKPTTVFNYLHSSLPSFIEFCSINGIKSFREVCKEDIIDYATWLKENRKVTKETGYKSTHIVEDIIRLGHIKGWNVSEKNIFSGMVSSEIWGTATVFQRNKTKPIPEDVFNSILYHASKDEKDILTKAGIIIQSQTGLRINEVLSIRKGCVHTTKDGDDYMEVSISKTEKGEPINHKVFINKLVVEVIDNLTKETEILRRDSGLKELFLYRYGDEITVLKGDKWTQKRLPSFIRRWGICDKNGNLYPLKSHQFRATFVRGLIKQKVPISYVMKQFSHVSIEMTSHYLTLQEEEVKNIYSDMLLRPGALITGIRSNEIKSKLHEIFHGKTEVEIENVVSNLSKSISFNPLPTGVCLYDFRRGNCTDGDGCFFYNCPNYITEVSFYPILKDELVLMEKEMFRFKELGRERDWQRQFVKWKYLKPLVESLEVQLNEEKCF